MRFLTLPKEARFSNKFLILFVLPIMFESLMTGLLGIVDTYMVSYLGETAVAGVALVNRLDNFAKQFFLALAQGGCVVLSQYIGAEKKELAEASLKENLRILTILGIILMTVVVIFEKQITALLFGGASPEVLKISNRYFSVTAMSYPFCAIFYCCTNVFRVLGNSRITMIASISMMALNLILKYIFIFQMDMGVFGAGLSTLLALAIVGLIMVARLTSKKSNIRLKGILKPDFDGKLTTRILKISVPNGLEQGMFQLGALAIAGIVSGLGTAAISADQIARNLCIILNSFGAGFTAAMLMVVGRCLGAGDKEEAKFYTIHILKLDYAFTWASAVIFLIAMPPLVHCFKVSPEAHEYAKNILTLYTCGVLLLYPSSFALPAALRASGDTKFVMAVASLSMLLFRIGAAYIFVNFFNLGVMGTWLAMVCDWVIRVTCFARRYKKGKWLERKVI